MCLKLCTFHELSLSLSRNRRIVQQSFPRLSLFSTRDDREILIFRWYNNKDKYKGNIDSDKLGCMIHVDR